ncbi:hypothetical protein Ahu01nite_039220 [Winogradskya humida]|uniref:Uncharacterized protein n=1 Tax=Winogradskya humida TaxID=113566 RepID=A0ABQ3ZQG1_9ACTN|nr:hypothetical protein Ahu01nite_039220 [Actinoplanes humidus]
MECLGEHLAYRGIGVGSDGLELLPGPVPTPDQGSATVLEGSDKFVQQFGGDGGVAGEAAKPGSSRVVAGAVDEQGDLPKLGSRSEPRESLRSSPRPYDRVTAAVGPL